MCFAYYINYTSSSGPNYRLLEHWPTLFFINNWGRVIKYPKHIYFSITIVNSILFNMGVDLDQHNIILIHM